MSSETQELSEAVVTWLHYKRLTGLGNLLKEYSITLPIAEYLTAKHGKEVQGEKAHPLFKTRDKGRPRQIDFVRVRGGEKTWFEAYECKFQTNDAARILDDICRLACLAQCRDDIGTPDRFFLYAGTMIANEPLMSTRNNVMGEKRQYFFSDLLSEEREENGHKDRKIFVLRNLREHQKKLFAKFANEYGAKIPSVIVTELAGMASSGGFGCAVWRVTQQKGSSLVSAIDLMGG